MTEENKVSSEYLKKARKISDEFDRKQRLNEESDRDYRFSDLQEKLKLRLEVANIRWDERIRENAVKAREAAERIGTAIARRVNKKYVKSRNQRILSKLQSSSKKD